MDRCELKDGATGGRLFDACPLPTRTRPGPVRSPNEVWDQLQSVLQGTAVTLEELPPSVATVDSIMEQSRRLSRTGYTIYQKAAPSFAEWLVGNHGPLLAVQAISELYLNGDNQTLVWRDALSVALRRAVTQTPETDYDETLAWCLKQCENPADWKKAAYFAFVLADDRAASHQLQPLAVLKQAESQGVTAGSESSLLPLVVDGPPAEVAAWRTRQKNYHSYFYYSAVGTAEASATLMAVARANGAPAAPQLGWLLRFSNEQLRAPIAEAILETREKDALAELLPFLHEKCVRQALDKAAGVYPGLVFRECLTANAPEDMEPMLRARLADFVRRHGREKAYQWAEGFDAEAADRLDRFFTADFAPIETLPAILRDPPWRRKKSKRKDDAVETLRADDIVLSVQPIPTPFSCPLTGRPWTPKYPSHLNCPVKDMKELLDFLMNAEKGRSFGGGEGVLPPGAAPAPDMSEDQALAWLASRLMVLSSEESRPSYRSTRYPDLYRTMEQLPERLALMLWELPELAFNSGVHWANTGPMMLSRFGERALPGLLKLIEGRPSDALGFGRWVDAPEIAPLAARAFSNPRLKKAKALAIEWLRGHRRTALTRLVPDAIGAPGGARDAAETVLRWFVRQDPKAARELPALVAEYAKTEPRVREAVEQVLDRDPLNEFPAKVAKLPWWVIPGALPRPRLRDGRALPDEAVMALAEMLSFSRPDAVYAGVAMTREICTAQSLGSFAWDLFSIWLANGAPNTDAWAMRAVGWIGDDECARKLTDLIRKWPWSARTRMMMGLDALADIGSDVALMNLSGIAEKARSRSLEAKAREKFAAVAEARELTPHDLADRLVLDLGLDERGGLDLDFGRRQFRVEFDEFLKPLVKNAKDERLRAFPKPGKLDDAGLAPAAVARWLTLKKDASAIADQQLIRLEAMLATSRRVRPDVFWTFFASHPLIRHLAQRLVWGFYDDATSTTPSLIFRVGSDLTFADSKDSLVGLDVGPEARGAVGLAHPVHMGRGESQVWGELFSDYEIMQPFPQIGRETFVLTDAEKKSSKINYFAGLEMKQTGLLNMTAQGWTLLNPTSNSRWIERPVRLANGERATVMLGLTRSGTLTVGELELKGDAQQDVPLRELDDVTTSEMLRSLTQFIGAGKA